ncbi:hypothetical protein EU245_00895 [Lentibacillus lipolyticus]|nr:hypothetical protein EU245_00895 [Lentibacillus lipolyticus]
MIYLPCTPVSYVMMLLRKGKIVLKPHKEKLETKLKDFRRFTATLLILASYLYMGTVINTYIHYSPDGIGLAVLAFAVTVAAGLFIIYSHQLKQKIQDNERA